MSLRSETPGARGALDVAPPWLAASVRRMGLASAHDDVTATAMTGGVSSDVYAVRAGEHHFCVKRPLELLRVAAEWHAPLSRGDREEAWLRFAAQVVPAAVPHVLATDPADHVFAMEILEPATFSSWKAMLLDGRTDTRVAAALGHDLAMLHRASTDSAAVMARFADQSMFESLRIDPYFGAVGRVHPALRAQLDDITADVLTPRAVIHGDVSPKNVLVSPRRVVLIDAECASAGDPAFDLAFCLTHLTLKAVHRPASCGFYRELVRELLSAYGEDVTSDTSEALAARVASQMSALLLARIDGKSPVEYLADDVRDVVRRVAVDLLRRPSRTPFEVFDRVTAART